MDLGDCERGVIFGKNVIDDRTIPPAGSLKIRSVEVSDSCVSGSYAHFVIKCSVREMTEFLPFLYENANLDEIRGDFILQKRRSFNPKIWDL